MTGPLHALLRWGTTAATSVMAIGAALEGTPWRAAAATVILCAAAMFAALPVAGLVLQAAAYRRQRDRLYVLLAVLVTAIVVADAVIGGLGHG
ncbi:MAG TPA: hypothetical protein VHF06_13935 [Pseudonocardiaceae bacterium]|nr:hypothetical protein [Pseudonocardiaceae bacterium]